MNRPEKPQALHLGDQASEGTSSMAPQAPRHENRGSSTGSQLAQSDGCLGSQSMPSGRSRLLPKLPPWQAHLPDPPFSQPSVPYLQPSYPILPSPYAPGRTQQDLASLGSPPFQQYTASETSNQYSLPSSYFSAITPSECPVSYQGYGGGGNTTSFRGVEGSRSSDAWPTYNRNGSALTSTDDSGRRIFQGSSIGSYNPGVEQSNGQGRIALSEMGSWGSRRVADGVNVLDDFYTDSFTVDPSQLLKRVPMENNPARQDQGARSPEIGYTVDPSAVGIDPSLQPPYSSEEYRSFVEDADKTNTDAFDLQNEGFSHDSGYIDSRSPRSPSSLAPSYDPGSRNILSPAADNTLPRFDHGAHSQLAPGSSKTCPKCKSVFSNSENRRRHRLEQHGQKFQYKCLLDKDGLPCTTVVTVARNRRRHVERIHPRESTELPPTSQNRTSNDETDEMLNGWFDKVLQSSTQ